MPNPFRSIAAGQNWGPSDIINISLIENKLPPETVGSYWRWIINQWQELL
jgi:hypothetical protein